MRQGEDIILVVDYHAQNIEFRWFNEATGEEQTGRYATTREAILRQVEQARREASPGGHVVWIMESTTGWARVQGLIGSKARFLLANVLQMPLPPKARRRKTDKIDTGRLLREYLHGDLPLSFQPAAWWRQVRRVVDCRQDLAERQTAIKNWINSLLQHETWEDRENLWSGQGRRRLDRLGLAASDRALLELKLQELDQLAAQQVEVEKRMRALYDEWPEAQWVDQVRGVGLVTAVSALAHVGPIERFATAEALIAYAGLAPGVRQSDGTRRNGRIGGGGTDAHLRYLVIEASVWLRDIPRYRPTYERVMKKRGKKIARIVVARLFLRSLHKMLKDHVRFNPAPRRPSRTAATQTTTAGL